MMNTPLTFGSLPTNVGTSMACANEECDRFLELFSACKGDYFMADPSEIVLCGECGESLRLARTHILVEVLS